MLCAITLSALAFALSAALKAKPPSAGQILGLNAAGLAAPLKFLNRTTFHQWVAHTLTLTGAWSKIVIIF
jgi:hypothetical protein